MAQNIDNVPKINIAKNKIVTREKLRVVLSIFRCDQNQTVIKDPRYTSAIAALISIGALMPGVTQLPARQRSGTTSAKTKTGKNEVILVDLL